MQKFFLKDLHGKLYGSMRHKLSYKKVGSTNYYIFLKAMSIGLNMLKVLLHYNSLDLHKIFSKALQENLVEMPIRLSLVLDFHIHDPF